MMKDRGVDALVNGKPLFIVSFFQITYKLKLCNVFFGSDGKDSVLALSFKSLSFVNPRYCLLTLHLLTLELQSVSSTPS